ncbi:MAG: serine/threonine-protein kinase [Rhizobacter sp.]
MSFPAGSGAALLCGGLLALALGAYLLLALPRLSSAVAWSLTGSLSVMLVAAAVFSGLLVPGAGAWIAVLLAAAAALLTGHAGWSLGRAAGRRTVPALPMTVAQPATPTPPGPPVSAPAAANASDHATLGRYHIERQLGRGAMGAVYLGRDPQIGRLVAIKTMALASEFEGAELVEARQRFFREAETAGRLQHPDIVTIFDAGEDHELAYIAMEFLRGHDLQRHTQSSQLLPLPLVVHIGERVANALAHAHTQGVVHRDVKPANVMVDLASGVVKVTDFGIARITDSSRTRTGMVLGTPSFMSPEQMSGRRVDGRADLYSLGVMLFQLLTGQLPHRAESMAKLMYAIANEPAPDLRALRPEIPEALALLVARALSKQPEARHADGRQLATALREVAALWPESALTPGGASAAAVVQSESPDSDAFAATVRILRTDPGHNSGL